MLFLSHISTIWQQQHSNLPNNCEMDKTKLHDNYCLLLRKN